MPNQISEQKLNVISLPLVENRHEQKNNIEDYNNSTADAYSILLTWLNRTRVVSARLQTHVKMYFFLDHITVIVFAIWNI